VGPDVLEHRGKAHRVREVVQQGASRDQERRDCQDQPGAGAAGEGQGQRGQQEGDEDFDDHLGPQGHPREANRGKGPDHQELRVRHRGNQGQDKRKNQLLI